MAAIRPHYRSFAGGEITPELFGRIDLTKFQTGLALSRNFWILAHGPAQNRHGFAFVNECRDSFNGAVLIPFAYNTEQTFAIEFGSGYIRWHTNGGTLLEASKEVSGASATNPVVIGSGAHGYLAGQTVYVSGFTDAGWLHLNNRFFRVGLAGADTYNLEGLDGAHIDGTANGAYSGGATMARVYEIFSPYFAADLATLHYAQSEDVLTITHRNHKPKELRRLGATEWELTDISFVPTVNAPGNIQVVASHSEAVPNTYVATALQDGSLEESLPSTPPVTVNNDLSIAAHFNTITVGTVEGAVRYNIYKMFNGLFGYIGQTDGAPFVDKNITPDVARTPAIASDPFSTQTNFPNGVGYYESRRVFGGTIVKPQNYWLTRSATEANMAYSIPTRDDDSIQGRVKAGEVNAIRQIAATANALVLLTSGGPWKLAPTNSDVLTPSSALPKQISGEGASDVPFAKTADELIYVGDAGNRFFSIKYRWESDGLVTEDMSLMAPHLFDRFTFVSMTYSKGPKMVWACRSDGKLIGQTYLPRHEVNAFHQHDTINGAFESVCSVKEGLDYPVYAIVRRTINNRVVRYIERMSTMRPVDIKDAFFVDSGVTYNGPAVTSLRVPHLIGELVAIMTDGGEQPKQIVPASGLVEFDSPSTRVHIGLPITADIQSLPILLEGQPAAGQSSNKNLGEVWLRVQESGGIFVGPTFTNMREYPARTNENYDEPPRLKSGIVNLTLDNNWDYDSRLCIRQTAPLPLTLAAMTIAVAPGG